MSGRIMRSMVLLGAVSLSGMATADDLRGADRLLCSTLEVTACAADAGCDQLLPADLNIPRFLVVDVAARTLATTPASGENRSTTVQVARREAGRIILQGYESGRAFSLLIEEATGRASFAAAGEGRSVTVFAACTPQR